MKKNLLLFLSTLLTLAHSSWAGGMYFVQNKGQWDSDILFRTEVPGGFLFLKKQSLLYVFYDAAKVSSLHVHDKQSGSKSSSKPIKDIENLDAHGVEVLFKNASPNVKLSSLKAIPTSFNYFVGNDPDKWAHDVQAYSEIVYEGIYEGIDMRMYMHGTSLKYEFIVQPRANSAAIQLKYEGAKSLVLNDKGQVLVETPLGSFKESVPYSFQPVNNGNKEVESKFELSSDNILRFSLPKGYDKNQKLVIDPELVFSTYSGSTSDNWGHTATYDDEGNLYSGGTVFGSSFPITRGAYQVKFQGLVDVGILKFSPDGSNLLYATFLGGSYRDIPTSLIVNKNKELVILGTTSSKDFPLTGTAFQKVFGGGTNILPISGLELENGSDIFLSKLSANGQQLTASTYLGGSGNDGVSTEANVKVKNYGDAFRGEVVVDQNENIIIVSSTNSKNFPLKNAEQNSLAGRQDGVVAMFSSNLSQLLWSTYVGGDGYDALFSVKVNEQGGIYTTGITQSTNLPFPSNAYQPKLKGAEDGFVVKFVNQKVASGTYLGTDKEDGAYLVDLDKAGNVYVLGLSYGIYPVSNGVYSHPKSNQFIHSLTQDLTQSNFSTVIGSGRGTPDISPTAFLVNECGNIYIAGWGGNVNTQEHHNDLSSTNGLVVTPDAMQKETNGSNFYIAILEEGAKSLLYATFFGGLDRSGRNAGDHVDGGTSRFDKNGVIYHATCACGGSFFPTTPGVWSVTNKSENCNNAAFKIDIDRLKADFDVYQGTKKGVTGGCAPLKLTFENMSEGGIEYLWDVNGQTISRTDEGGDYTFTQPGEYMVTLKAYNRLSCKRVDIAQKKIVISTLDVATMPDTSVCENTSLKLWAKGGTSYKWTPATGLDNPSSANPTVVVQKSDVYSVEISNGECKVTRQVKVNVGEKTDFVAMPDEEVCLGESKVLTVTGKAEKYKWLAAPGLPETYGNSVTVKPEETTIYQIEGIYEDGCRPLREIKLTVDKSYTPNFEVIKLAESCDEPVRYTMKNTTTRAARQEWNLGVGNTIDQQSIENYEFETPGEYTISLTTFNAAGCSLTSTQKITVEPKFELTNVITPNGDGKNDTFVVPVSNSKLEVFNRWGKSVFNANNYSDNWGKGVAPGTYFYVVETPNGKRCKGWIEVLK